MNDNRGQVEPGPDVRRLQEKQKEIERRVEVIELRLGILTIRRRVHSA